jgi:hypothetical protein
MIGDTELSGETGHARRCVSDIYVKKVLLRVLVAETCLKRD